MINSITTSLLVALTKCRCYTYTPQIKKQKQVRQYIYILASLLWAHLETRFGFTLHESWWWSMHAWLQARSPGLPASAASRRRTVGPWPGLQLQLQLLSLTVTQQCLTTRSACTQLLRNRRHLFSCFQRTTTIPVVCLRHTIAPLAGLYIFHLINTLTASTPS